MSLRTASLRVVTSGPRDGGREIERAATRFVRTWGFTTVEMVAGRFRLLTRASAPRAALARRALGALSDVAWLDPAHEWFTLVDRSSVPRASIEKVHAVVGAAPPEELELALGKRHSFGVAPPAVVRAYLQILSERVVRRGAICGDARPTVEELALLAAFEGLGGVADLGALRDATRGHLSPVALARVLQTSPLFLRSGRGTYRLVGAPHWTAAPALLPSPQWQAAL